MAFLTELEKKKHNSITYIEEKGLLGWMEQRKGNVEKLIKMVHKYTM